MSGLINTLMPLIIIAVITLLVYAMIKFKSPLVYGLFAVIIVFGGVYSTFVCVEYYTQKSEVRGTMKEVDPYEGFDIYNVDIEGISWYKDVSNNIYYLERTYNTSVDFDGTDKQFNVLINEQPCEQTKSTAGRLWSKTALRIKDVDGNYMSTINVILNMTFYSNKVVLVIQTDATDTNINNLKQYCQINGLSIRILDGIGTYYPILTQEAV